MCFVFRYVNKHAKFLMPSENANCSTYFWVCEGVQFLCAGNKNLIHVNYIHLDATVKLFKLQNCSKFSSLAPTSLLHISSTLVGVWEKNVGSDGITFLRLPHCALTHGFDNSIYSFWNYYKFRCNKWICAKSCARGNFGHESPVPVAHYSKWDIYI